MGVVRIAGRMLIVTEGPSPVPAAAMKTNDRSSPCKNQIIKKNDVSLRRYGIITNYPLNCGSEKTDGRYYAIP
jgi:hypothetical protein